MKNARKIKSLLRLHLRCHERGSALYKRSGDAMAELLSLAPPVGEPIKLTAGLTIVIEDQFATKNSAFKAAHIARYVVKEHKPLPAPRPKKTAASEPATAITEGDALP